MEYITDYDSVLGRILLAGREDAVTGLWFYGQKYFGASLEKENIKREIPVLKSAVHWLDAYFRGENPSREFLLKPKGTAFQREVWELLLEIPYGEVTTYKKLAEKIAGKRGLISMSAQAVGGAVGHNPVSLLIPCHRVIGTDGSLTGYAGGIEKKEQLLKLEKGRSIF